MATTLEDTGLWLPRKMDAKIPVITVGHTTLINVEQTVGSLLKPGILLTQNTW